MTFIALLARPTGIFLGLCIAASPAAARAQSPAVVPHTPDMFGLYTGMPSNPARAMLQKHSSTINVSATSEAGFSWVDGANRDSIEVSTTLPPNDPAVWMIRRSQNLVGLAPMTKGALLSALRAKYGQETLTRDRGGGGLYLYWIFDQSGRLLPTASQTLTGCSGAPFTPIMVTGPPQAPSEAEKACFASFFALTAFFNLQAGSDLLQSYSVELVNLPLAYRAAAVIASAKNAAAEQARKAAVQQGDQNKPAF